MTMPTRYTATCSHDAGATPWHGDHVFTVNETTVDAEGTVAYYAKAEHFGCGKNCASPYMAIRMLAHDNACSVSMVRPLDHALPPASLNGYPVVVAMQDQTAPHQWLVVVHRKEMRDYVAARWHIALGDTWSQGDYCQSLPEAITAAMERAHITP